MVGGRGPRRSGASSVAWEPRAAPSARIEGMAEHVEFFSAEKPPSREVCVLKAYELGS